MTYKRVKPFTPTALTVSLGKQFKEKREQLNINRVFLKDQGLEQKSFNAFEGSQSEITLNVAMRLVEGLAKKTGKKLKVLIIDEEEVLNLLEKCKSSSTVIQAITNLKQIISK